MPRIAPLTPGPVRYERHRPEHGFLMVRCTTCHGERLVAFSCKRRGFCPSCGARRMTESPALLVDKVLQEEPIRQCLNFQTLCSECNQGKTNHHDGQPAT